MKKTVSRRCFIEKTAYLAGAFTGITLFSPGITNLAGAQQNHDKVKRINPPHGNTKPFKVGDSFNESDTLTDPATSRPKIRLTSRGERNNTSYMHYNTLFTDDSRYVFLQTQRGDNTAILKADITTGDLTVVAESKNVAGLDFYKTQFSTVPNKSVIVAKVVTGDGRHQKLRQYDINTFEETILHEIPDDQEAGHPIPGHDGRYLFWPQRPRISHEDVSGVDWFNAYIDEFGGIPTTIYEMDLASGKIREIYHDPVCQTNHMHANPVYPDLLLIERDQPPLFSWRGDYGETSRNWVLDRVTGKLTEIKPMNPNRFQMHCSWSFDGEYVLHHSRDKETGFPFFGKNGGGHYIGVGDLHGNAVWERIFPYLYYGHVAGHTQKPSVVFDSLVTPDLICEIEYAELTGNDIPEIKILAHHGSVLTTGSAYSHPHMQVSPDGKWMVYNYGDGVRSDVYLVQL